MTLQGKNIAILIAPRGTEEPEFVEPRDAVLKAGANVTVVGLETAKADGQPRPRPWRTLRGGYGDQRRVGCRL